MTAQDRIKSGQYSPTDYMGVYSLFMTAFDNKPLAEKMKSRAAEAYMQAKTQKVQQ